MNPNQQFEIYYDVCSFDFQILKMRNERARIITILNEAISRMDILDEQILLSHILNVLDKYNIAVSHKEVRTGFNKYFNKSYHGEKRSYLGSLYTSFKIKKGTVTRRQPTKKHSPAVINEPKKAQNKPFFTPDMQSYKTSQKPSNFGLREVFSE